MAATSQNRAPGAARFGERRSAGRARSHSSAANLRQCIPGIPPARTARGTTPSSRRCRRASRQSTTASPPGVRRGGRQGSRSGSDRRGSARPRAGAGARVEGVLAVPCLCVRCNREGQGLVDVLLARKADGDGARAEGTVDRLQPGMLVAARPVSDGRRGGTFRLSGVHAKHDLLVFSIDQHFFDIFSSLDAVGAARRHGDRRVSPVTLTQSRPNPRAGFVHRDDKSAPIGLNSHIFRL